MFSWGLMFLIIAVVAGVAVEIAWILLVVGLILSVIFHVSAACAMPLFALSVAEKLVPGWLGSDHPDS